MRLTMNERRAVTKAVAERYCQSSKALDETDRRQRAFKVDCHLRAQYRTQAERNLRLAVV